MLHTGVPLMHSLAVLGRPCTEICQDTRLVCTCQSWRLWRRKGIAQYAGVLAPPHVACKAWSLDAAVQMILHLQDFT